jgi:hypothetical protein
LTTEAWALLSHLVEELVKAAAWPVAAIVIVKAVQPSIAEAIAVVRRLKFGDLEVEFDLDKRLAELKTKAIAAGGLETLPALTAARKTASVEPWTAIRAAGRELEALMRSWAERAGYMPARREPGPGGLEYEFDASGELTTPYDFLSSRSSLRDEEMELYDGLQWVYWTSHGQGWRAVGVNKEPTAEEARDYVDLVAHFMSLVKERAEPVDPGRDVTGS